jgi:hypothetical protein
LAVLNRLNVFQNLRFGDLKVFIFEAFLVRPDLFRPTRVNPIGNAIAARLSCKAINYGFNRCSLIGLDLEL